MNEMKTFFTTKKGCGKVAKESYSTLQNSASVFTAAGAQEEYELKYAHIDVKP